MTYVVVYATLDVVISFLKQHFESDIYESHQTKKKHKLLVPAPLRLGTYPKEMRK